jgi:hypothetical protein
MNGRITSHVVYNMLEILVGKDRLWMKEQPPIWRVAANILNKQLQTADKGWSPSFGVG